MSVIPSTSAPVLSPTAPNKEVGGSKPSSRPFWSVPAAELLSSLRATPQGLTGDDARQRLASGGAQARQGKGKTSTLTILASQFKSPILLLLLFAVGLSFFLHDVTNAVIILAIVLMSGLLGFWQERGAADAVEKLLAIIQIKATLLRDGKPAEVAIEEIVPGDIVLLHAGDVIPGDSLLLESNNLFVNEAALTGETFPVEKTVGVLPAETPLSQRTNSLFTGTYAVSGTGTVLVVKTGKETEFGKVSETLRLRPPETDFERGIRRFGYLLMEVTLLMVISIFAINVYLHRPVLESFLFALALAVGLTPQLLPAIISVNLAHGAKRMAEAKVIVKRLASIENFGSMDILCSDKTGTLTLGEVQLNVAANVEGKHCDKMLLYAQLNAFFQTGYTNPIDAAIVAYRPVELSEYKKLDEEPYDFVRKRLSILVGKGDARLMVTKGALSNILEICTTAETDAGAVVEIAVLQAQIQKQFEEFSAQGFRVVGVAYRDAGAQTQIGKDDEKGMTFLGFLALFDPIKPGTVETIQTLRKLGISLKVITGDNRLVAAYVGSQAGLSTINILTGPDLRNMSHAALRQRVNNVDIFAEIEPNQKEALIVALKQAGHVVGYIGDGINDASALHVADVGISVANAVDVAKEAADIVLLEKDLAVLEHGVGEGRITFANTLKYVFMATSANFGNMFSMAGASLLLPFLPLLPTQILLTNLMTDFPEMTIANDSVDSDMADKPHRWDIGFIRRFMMVFGLVSSVFDYATFGVLLFLLHANAKQFRTGWFMESVVSASLIVLVIRTHKPFYRSRPGTALLIATLATVAATLLLPYTPLARVFGFAPVPPLFLLALALIVIFYVAVAEVAKVFFYRHEGKKAAYQDESAAR
jgi:Mg2+-importing ATPase